MNPYQKLKSAFWQYVSAARNPAKIWRVVFAKDRVAAQQGFRLDDVNEMVRTAAKLGYSTGLEVQDDGLHVFHFLKVPNPPAILD